MSGRILMATVATLALAMPAMAQDEAAPSDTQQQMEQGLQEGATPEGATEQAPAMTEEQPAEEQAPAMAEEQPATPPADMEFLQVQEEAQFLANSEVVGKDVVNNMGEPVGSIADLVMDQDQKLVGVVLSVGGFLGMGAKWVAVPVEQIDFPTADEPARLLATATEEQLTNAPDFTTREAIEAEQAAAEAQSQATQQQQQVPSPTVPAQ